MTVRQCDCGNNLFRIQEVLCCDDCSENGAWDKDADGYTHDAKLIFEKDLLRDQVSNDGECEFGSAHGAGCVMYICSECKKMTHLAYMESC